MKLFIKLAIYSLQVVIILLICRLVGANPVTIIALVALYGVISIAVDFYWKSNKDTTK